MATYSKGILSGSTNGTPIVINSALASAGTTIHTACTTDLDEVWLWGSNTAADNRKITVQFGAVASDTTGVEISYVIPSLDGLHLLIPGIPLNGAKVVSMYATASEAINISGYVNRIAT